MKKTSLLLVLVVLLLASYQEKEHWAERYKYCLYSEGVKRESLIDMQFDPEETVNQAENPLYKKGAGTTPWLLKKRSKTNQRQKNTGNVKCSTVVLKRV